MLDDDCREEISFDLSDMRARGFDEGDINLVKKHGKQISELLASSAGARLRPLLKSDVTAEQVAVALNHNPYDRIDTRHQELKYATQTIPYIEPRSVFVSKSHEVVSFDIGEIIIRLLQHDRAFRQRVLAKSEEWKRGDSWCSPSQSTLDSVDSGIAARYHPHLMRPATAQERDDVRVGWILQADDIEVSCLCL